MRALFVLHMARGRQIPLTEEAVRGAAIRGPLLAGRVAAVLCTAALALAPAGTAAAPASAERNHVTSGTATARARASALAEAQGSSLLGSLCGAVEMKERRGCEECPSLSNELCQLLRADDPVAHAASRRLVLMADRVRVEIELLEDPEGVAATFDLAVEAQYGVMLQALAPLPSLCDLAIDPRVLRVRAPIPLTPT